MGDRSNIEWTDATWNPVTGCTKVSQGCKFCYAERVFPRAYAGQTVLAYRPDGSPITRRREFTDVQCHPERLDQPLHWKKPRRIFVNSMSDLFHEVVPVEFIDRVFAVMAQAPRHTFQILTKRPERMRDYSCGFASVCPKRRSLRIRDSMYKGHPAEALVCGTPPAHVGNFPWPLPNVQLGVSCEDQVTADERIPLLLQTPTAVRFISAEPLLGPVDLRRIKSPPDPSFLCRAGLPPARVDWVIVGGESGPNARPMHPDWARLLRDQCVAAGVPYFFKQWGEWMTSGQMTEEQRVTMIDHFKGKPPYVSNGSVGTDGHLYRIGKKAAGALLDGREWREYPVGKR